MKGPDREFVLILTTVPDHLDVDGLVRPLVAEGLVACANVLPPMRSIYRWRGAVETADERQLILKTSRAQVAAVQAHLASGHPYEVPEFLVLRIADGSDGYLAWLRDQTPAAERGSRNQE
jgi:periplasmic divalent cation tolerance protein